MKVDNFHMLKMLLFVSVFLMFAGLTIYPLGLGSHYVKFYCGEDTSGYRSGNCYLGWTYMLAIAGNALSIFCPIFSYLGQEDYSYKRNINYSNEKV